MTEISRLVPRLIDADENSQLFTTTHLVLALPASLERVTSFAVMPGLGEHRRVTVAINAWQSTKMARHLLISGSHPGEAKQPQLTLARLQKAPFNLRRTDGVLTQLEAAHTRIQTDWIIEQVVNNDITSTALFASDWHMPRAYRTLLKSMLNADLKIPIFPVVTGSSPYEVVPEYDEAVISLSVGETHRIKKYEENGQIASFVELTDYLDWLWKQQVVPITQ